MHDEDRVVEIQEAKLACIRANKCMIPAISSALQTLLKLNSRCNRFCKGVDSTSSRYDSIGLVKEITR